MENTRRIYLLNDTGRVEEDIKALEEIENLFSLYSDKKFPIDISDRLSDNSSVLEYRRDITKVVGFTLITDNLLYNLSSLLYGNKCLEIMAGNGSLSKGLQDYGVDITPTDNYSMEDYFDKNMWTDVENIDAVDAIIKYGKDVQFVLCSWIPYYQPIGYEAIKKLYEVNPNAIFIYIGEEQGGCTADDNFFKYSSEISISERIDIDNSLLEKIEKSLKNWHGINAKIKFMRYNGEDKKVYKYE